MPEPVLIAIAVMIAAVLLVGVVGYFFGDRAKPSAPAVAVISEEIRLTGAGASGLALAVLTNVGFLLVGVFTTRNVLQEISSVLLWIGSNVLYGMMLFAGRRRRYVVRRIDTSE